MKRLVIGIVLILVVAAVYSQSHIVTTEVTRQYDQQSLGFGI